MRERLCYVFQRTWETIKRLLLKHCFHSEQTNKIFFSSVLQRRIVIIKFNLNKRDPHTYQHINIEMKIQLYTNCILVPRKSKYVHKIIYINNSSKNNMLVSVNDTAKYHQTSYTYTIHQPPDCFSLKIFYAKTLMYFSRPFCENKHIYLFIQTERKKNKAEHWLQNHVFHVHLKVCLV